MKIVGDVKGEDSKLCWLGRVEEAKLLRAQGQHEMAINLAKYISENRKMNEAAVDVYRLVGKCYEERLTSNECDGRVCKWLQKQLTMDKEEVEKLQQDRDNFLSITLEGYKRCLVIADKYDVRVVFGSAGVIENPMDFAKSVGVGIKYFLSVPAKSFMKSRAGLIIGMAQGTTSLLSNTARLRGRCLQMWRLKWSKSKNNIDMKREEMRTKIVDHLSPEEKTLFSCLNPEIEELKERLVASRATRVEVCQ
ncbi:unnamed protein product [Lactuca saligna]|uniref:Uncharacterized protein n=1 Tax=Lactuca saligna TaxID=75948 RepID=A0AA36E9S9_LACSI|nr:unnamed protein product [Lactuca saligna]